MLIVLIGEGKMHKLVLPQVPSGTYRINEEFKNNLRTLIEVESKDGKWQISSDFNTKILNPENIKITEDRINFINTDNLVMSRVVLQEYMTYTLAIEDTKSLYTLCCLPVYEDNWIRLNIKSVQEISIGRNASNNICYANEMVANVHSKLFFRNGMWIVENYDKKYGTFVNGNLVNNKEIVLFNGDVIFIMGLKLILLGNCIFVNNPNDKMIFDDKIFKVEEVFQEKKENNDEDDDKYLELYSAKDYFYRSPRIIKKDINEQIKIEPPPTKKEDDNMPMFLTLGSTISMGMISLVMVISTMSGIFSGATSLSESILSIITSVAMVLATLLIPILMMKWEKKRDKKYEAKRIKRYSEYMEKKRKDIDIIKNNRRALLYENYATTEECVNIILKRDKRLWERISKDDDFLVVNLGVGDIPLDIKINYPEKEEFTMAERDEMRELLDKYTKDMNVLKNAPVTVSLAKEKIIAYIDKNPMNVDKFMQSLLVQLMAHHSYHDLKFVCLLKKDNFKRWDYIKMFPYIWNDEKTFRFFEDDYDNMDEISKYLEDEMSKRNSADNENNEESTYKDFNPYYMIITDDYRKIENLKIVTRIFEEERNLGFSIFCITDDIMQLPNECKTFISVNQNMGKVFNSELSKKNEINFKFDNLSTIFFDNIEKTISNIPIKYSLAEKSILPNHYTFLEMYNVGLIEQLNILDRWKSNDSTLSLAAPIGINSAGKIINLDIHEKFHGPHGLIAGSTGSGKSEFIITYILSLALNFHPDDVAFVLIDYKGGGLTGAFQKKDAKLPHVVGTITNIDKEGLERSLISIRSELKRRQVLFNEAREMTDGGVIDIYKYQKLYHNGILTKPIPHLLIICDEFAELKQQQPAFMDELVSVSRIGRSLGVHLILATQKPSGIVDEQIRSNSKFAICLKVQDKSDSTDVIERVDAAYIKQSGRFYIKVGNNDYFDMGQSGWSGASYYPADTTKKQKDDSIKFIANNGRVIKEINDYSKKPAVSQGEQLTNIIDFMIDLAKKENIQPKQLWLDDIPEKIYLSDIKNKYKFKKKDNSVILTIGEYDDPENQKQGIINLDLVKNGNMAIFGNAESGKETLMSTIVYDLITTYSPEDVWIYILDFGTESLKIFREAPQVGEAIFNGEGEKLRRFFDKIKEIVAERKKILSNYNGDYNFFLKTSGKKMPLITILINAYDTFTENYEDVFDDVLLTLTREAAKCGIIFVVSASVANDMRYRMAQNFKQKVALSLNEISEYSSIFEGLGNKRPAQRFGRGLINLSDNIFEFQTAKSCLPEEYNVFIKNEIEELNKKYKSRAEGIPVLPNVVKAENLPKLESVSEIPLGLRKKDMQPELYDFRNNFITVISSKIVENAMQFSLNLLESINKIAPNDVIILDPERKILSGKNELTNSYETLIKNIDKKNKNLICFIFGLDKFINFLEENERLKNKSKTADDDDDDDDDEVLEGTTILENILNKCEENKNVTFVMIDAASKIKEHNYDEWFSENVLDNNIIWVGEGIDDQYILDINATRKDIDNNCGCSFGYINKSGKTIMIKLLEMKEKREDDE